MARHNPSCQAPDTAAVYGIVIMFLASAVVGGELFAESPTAASESNERIERVRPADVIDRSSDLLRYREFSSKLAREFEPGSAEPRASELPTVTEVADGFVIRMDTGSPVSTPTVFDGRLFVSGGFNSTEFHCFDAKHGKHIWTVDLSDDGPSIAAIDDGVLTISTESCTLFALDAKTGKHLWSFYLGDPLLSSPAIANGRVFAVYPLPETDDPAQAEGPDAEPRPETKTEGVQQPDTDSPTAVPTHAIVCFELRSGKILWQHALDTDCITAPVVSADEVFVVTMSGLLYRFSQKDGSAVTAHDLQATTPPVISGKSMYVSRRISTPDGQGVREMVAHCDLLGRPIQGSVLAWSAPHLDRAIQELSKFTKHATEIEAANGIGGGFGGGFFQVTEKPGGSQTPDDGEGNAASGTSVSDPQEFPDLLARTQNIAADLIGLGNVATLQCYQGSRPLLWSDRCFSCIGSKVICFSANNSELIWEQALNGDVREIGGHLGTPPVPAGEWLFVATVSGDVLQIAPTDGSIARRYDAGAEVRFAPTVMDGRIYVGTQAGEVRCIRTDNPHITGWSGWGGDPAHSNVCRWAAPWHK